MLARVTAGKSGVIEYLENGMKNGRDFTRDELDLRVCIDGNIRLTDALLKNVSREDRDNYYHITLSFKETDITSEQIKEAYNDYKDKLLNAYDDKEFNVYAEIHLPKIKSYTDKRTGETIERFPHVHMIIPKKNLLTNGDLNPFGEYKKMEHYHDAIQESVNYKFDLSSPYDNQRKMSSNADLISRYKGDEFKGKHAELKGRLFDAINNSNVRTWDEFKNVASQFGEVSESKNAQDKYLKIKLPGESKNIRLKESCFSSEYIENRLYRVARPTQKQVDGKLSEWLTSKSHEIKHIVKAGKKLRDSYFGLDKDKRQDFLKEVINKYEHKHNIRQRGRARNLKPGVKHITFGKVRTFADISNRMSRMPKRNVDDRIKGFRDGTESLLPNNELLYVGNAKSRQHNDVRWIGNQSGGRGRDLSVVSQSGVELGEKIQVKNDLEAFRQIRKELHPNSLFDELGKYGVARDSYSYFKVSDGSYRIRVGTTNLNPSDFLTKHINLPWVEAKEILIDAYQKQLENKLDNDSVNCIIFKASDSNRDKYTVNDSIRVFNLLKRKENREEDTMQALNKLRSLRSPEANEIVPKYKTLSFKELFQQQEELRKQFAEPFKLNDLVASKDLKNSSVHYKHAVSGETIFTDQGDRIRFEEKNPSDSAVLNGLKMAAEKFGVVELKGTEEFKDSVLTQAVNNAVKVVFSPEALQSKFVEMIAAAQVLKDVDSAEMKKGAAENNEQEQAPIAKNPQSTETNVAHKFDYTPENESKVNTFSYQWDKEKNVLNLKVNDKPISEVKISEAVIDNLRKQDPFLQNFERDEILKGTLSMDKVVNGSEPRNLSVNDQGEKVKLEEPVNTDQNKNVQKL